MSQFIEIYLEKAFSKFHMSIEIANSDDLFWRINEITCAYEKFHYDLCILWLNNVIAPPNRMEAVCSLIKTLTDRLFHKDYRLVMAVMTIIGRNALLLLRTNCLSYAF